MMGFNVLPRTKKKKRKVFLYQVQADTLFHNGTAAKKATRTSSALSSLETVQKAPEKKERDR